MTTKVTLIDPPSGWKYGFPKVFPSDLTVADIPAWLVENGYPQWEIDSCGDSFYVRHFTREQ